MLSESEKLQALQTILQYQFRTPDTLLEAITHSSYSNELSGLPLAVDRPNNERLEFLGDAVIGLVIAKLLMQKYPQASEGRLSRWRGQLVSRKKPGRVSVTDGLWKLFDVGQGERRTGGANKRSILAGVMESIVGALYQMPVSTPTEQFLVRLFEPQIEGLYEKDQEHVYIVDKKTLLQEHTQAKHKKAPEYQVLDTWGPDHQKRFRVEIRVDGEPVAQGEGRSKKEAEQNAAQLALEILEF